MMAYRINQYAIIFHKKTKKERVVFTDDPFQPKP